MTDLRVELAFNTAQGAISSIYDYHLYPLQQGLVDTDAVPPRAAWYTWIKPGDTLRFALFDASPKPGAFAPTLLQIDFRDPASPQGAGHNPFPGVDLPLRFEAANLRPENPLPSAVFGTRSGWKMLDAAGQEAVFTFGKNGVFLMNGRLTVENEGRQRLFAFDPEVIVGPNGPGG